jgi:hypothetical protein
VVVLCRTETVATTGKDSVCTTVIASVDIKTHKTKLLDLFNAWHLTYLIKKLTMTLAIVKWIFEAPVHRQISQTVWCFDPCPYVP